MSQNSRFTSKVENLPQINHKIVVGGTGQVRVLVGSGETFGEKDFLLGSERCVFADILVPSAAAMAHGSQVLLRFLAVKFMLLWLESVSERCDNLPVQPICHHKLSQIVVLVIVLAAGNEPEMYQFPVVALMLSFGY